MKAFSLVPLVAACLLLAACGQTPSTAASGQSQPAASASGGEASSVAGSHDQAAPPGDYAETQASHTADAGQSTVPAAEAVAPAAPVVGKRPRADRTPTRPGDAEKITFDDLNLGMQADVVFRDFMLTDRVKELEGKRISIVGYMHGGQAGQRGIDKFILLKNKECKFGPGGQADHLADVHLKQDTKFTGGDVKVEGTLTIEPFQGPDGNTWSIYRLADAQIR
jgi:hypothetical protein